MHDLSTLRVAVIGASYGGLCAGLALACVGADVQIFERSRSLSRIGGGIVVQPDFAEYLEAFGYARPDSVAIPTQGRRFLARDGSILHTSRDATFYTGWDTVLRSLQKAFPDERLHVGSDLRSFSQRGDAVDLLFAGTGGRDTVSVDLLVGADGIGSVVRRSLLPDISPRYAGYVGFRGLLPEVALSPAQADLFRDHFVLFDYPKSHVLSYLIPGESGETAPGARRFNWVWYVGVSEEELGVLLTDPSGRTHRSSIGPGEMTDRWKDRLRDKARQDLPPLVADAVVATEHPFAQAIFDLESPRLVHGRAVLLGDAGFLVRPHTASGASKAAGDAVALAHALRDSDGDIGTRLRAWETERIGVARRIVAHGQHIAARGGLGS